MLNLVPAPAPSLPPVRGPRVWFRVGTVPFTTARLSTMLLVAAGLVALAVFWQRIDVEALHAHAQSVPGWAVIAVIAIAPLLGVPVAMLHVVAGVRFGIVPGLIVVAVTTAFHHLAGFAGVKLAPGIFAERLAGWRKRFPRGAHRPMTILCCLLPGMPYVVQLYLLPVLGVPLWTLLNTSAPLHVFRAIVSVVGGDLSDELTAGRVAGLVAYYVVLSLVCAFTYRRIRAAMHQERQ